jgi:hypothetical protein
VVRHERLPSARAGGPAVRIRWPEGRVTLDPVALGNLLVDYAQLNPHLHLRIRLGAGGEREYLPTRPDWKRWRPSDPEPALWYDVERFERRVAAAVQHDRARGERGRTVRAFVATFQGLSSTAKQKELLEPFGLHRASLKEAFVRPDGTLDRGRIGRLLEAMQGRTSPVRARRLGELGRAHLASGTPRGVVAHRRIEIDDPRSPVLAEAALILLGEDDRRSVTVGINNSPALAGGDAIPGLWDALGQASVEPEDPVWFFLHVTGPGFRYADRGKSRLVLTGEVAGRLADELRSMLEPWRKHKRRRERDSRAAAQAAVPILPGTQELQVAVEIVYDIG